MALRFIEINNNVIITKSNKGKILSSGSMRDWDPREEPQSSSLEDNLQAVQDRIDSAIADELSRE
jgi:hypothetical protein